MDDVTYLGQTDFRGKQQKFGIRQTDRLFHTYIIGKTGTGKTTLLFNQIIQDIRTGRGLALVDPHGDLAEKVVQSMPASRLHDLVYLDIADPNCQFGYNPLKSVSANKRSLVASGIIEILKKLHDSKSWGAKMEHILRNVLLTLLDQDRADFSDIAQIMTDKDFRNQCLRSVSNKAVRDFWTKEFNKYNPFQRSSAIAPILNKVGAFITNSFLAGVLLDDRKLVSFRQCMDERKIVVINLAKGSIGEDASLLLGGLLINSIGLAAFSRSDTAEDKRPPFMVYVDEFQSFSTKSIANMLSELRKYKVGMVLANQHLLQLDPDIRNSVLGNVGTIISFRLGVSDAKYMADEFHPTFGYSDIVDLPNYHIYLNLMIDGVPSRAFSAISLNN